MTETATICRTCGERPCRKGKSTCDHCKYQRQLERGTALRANDPWVVQEYQVRDLQSIWGSRVRCGVPVQGTGEACGCSEPIAAGDRVRWHERRNGVAGQVLVHVGCGGDGDG